VLIVPRELLTEAMRRAFGTAKELACAGGFSVITAERYRRGEGFPDGLTLTRFMGRSRVIAEAVMRMAGLDDLSLDQEQARLVRSLAELEAKRAKRNEALAAAYAVAGIAEKPPAQAKTRSNGSAATAAGRSAGRTAAPGRASR
jgi:hypothetical protein